MKLLSQFVFLVAVAVFGSVNAFKRRVCLHP